jgi:hypothetical protein
MNLQNSMEPLTHNVKNDKDWNESYYFIFYDQKQRIGGMSRLGFKPNKQEGTLFLILFLPDGSASLFNSGEKVTDEARKEKTAISAMTYQRLASGVWHYNFNGSMVVAKKPEDLPKLAQHKELIERINKVNFDLSLTPINEICEYSKNMTPESLELGKKSGDQHWEQIGKVAGQIRINDFAYQLEDVMGQRDHTHGLRDWTGIGNWLYFVVWFNEDLCVNPAAIIADDGRVSSGGFIFKDGQNIPVKSIRVLDQTFGSNNLPISCKVEIVDSLGERHELKGKTGPMVPLPFMDERGQLSFLVQAFGEFVFDGRVGGYGSFENLRKFK